MENQNEVKQKKKMGCLPKLGIGLLVLVVIGIIFGDSESTNTYESTVADSQLSEEVKEEPKKEVKEEAPVEDTTETEEVNVPREFKNALKKAKSYAEMMHMSKAGIYEQLTSEYGESFPAEAAQYAIDNLEWDYKENAYKKAKSYAEGMAMSDDAVYDQLISEYGEKFTKEEAEYAINKLNENE